MAVTDTDYSLMMLRLAQFEDKLKKLEQEIEALKPKTTYAVAGGCLVCGRYDCTSARNNLPCPNRTVYSEPYYGDPPYALSSGSLSDSGSIQKWSKPTDINIYAEFQVAKDGEDIEE